jgi:hypothetical protein
MVFDERLAGRDGISPADAAAWSAEQRRLDADGDFFFTCVQFCFTAVRPGSAAHPAY